MTDDLRERLDDLVPAPEPVPDRFEKVRRRVVHRRRRQVAGGVVAAVAVVAAVVPLTLSSDRTDGAVPASGSEGCPATLALGPVRLPVPPAATGVDAASRLVPTEVPQAAVLCAYQPATSDSVRFFAATPLPAAGLPELAADLSMLPRSPRDRTPRCPSPIDFEPASYLLRLDYPGGHVWVSTDFDAGGCPATTNGAYASPVSIYRHLTAVQEKERWFDRNADPDPCGIADEGRIGQERAMVPGSPVSVSVCDLSSDRTVVHRDPEDVANIAGALNDAPVMPMGDGCTTTGGQGLWFVEFAYREGPPVLVRVEGGCRPAVTNGSLASDSDDLVAYVKGLVSGT